MKKLIASFIVLCATTAYGQFQSEYTYTYPFMSDMVLMKKNRVLEITATTIDTDLENGTSSKENIHYVFDESGRILMEFKGEAFKKGELQPDEYALNFEYATASNLPTKILIYQNVDGEIKAYQHDYVYDGQSNLVSFKSTQDNTVRTFKYENGKIVSLLAKSDQDYLNDNVIYKYPSPNEREEHGWGSSPNSTDDVEGYYLRLIDKLNAKGKVVESIYNPTIGAENIIQYVYSGNQLTQVIGKLGDGSVSDKQVLTYGTNGLLTQSKTTFFQFYSTDKTREVTTTFKYDYR